MLLFLDGNRGIYLPQSFANCVDRACVSGVAAVHWETLEAGPEHENYWDAWDTVLQCAKITYKGEPHYLHQDGDLWLVKEGEEPDE